MEKGGVERGKGGGGGGRKEGGGMVVREDEGRRVGGGGRGLERVGEERGKEMVSPCLPRKRSKVSSLIPVS